ncbi:helix-turn-helix domain-containing protein [Nocardia sp. NPDC050712]|uniref:PucR family transcriptional regulator n=1 Tax=Nocardia sp. NPDC050712 TaxID=3155518 RepID=UPI0033C0BA0A
MSVSSSYPSDLTMSGQPVTTSLKDVRTLSKQMVGHFLETVVPCRTLPGEALNGDVTTITRVCLELAVSMLDGSDIPGKTQQLGHTAAAWAREGIPIDTIHHAVHEGIKLGLDLILTDATAEDFDSLKILTRRLMEVLDTITSTVARAYVRELRTVVSEHHTAAHTLTSALLSGHANSTMARECGIDIADEYQVFAVALGIHPDEENPALNREVVARRKLRRVQAALATHFGQAVLSLLSVDGGTVLLPATLLGADELDEFVADLARAARVPITAGVVLAPAADVPEAADRAHQVLDMVSRLKSPPKLYRFDELALEYQLTRPGPALDYLRNLLDPLEEHPDLLETLESHIANNLNRQRTARAMHVHTNTIDYRLKRVSQLTGLDATQASGLWYLRSAIVARSYQRRPTTGRAGT